MQPVANTPEILYCKATHHYPGDTLVQWAIDMLEAGYDTEHLRILAGTTPPYSGWYLQPLTDRVFNELGIDVSDAGAITHKYICWLVGEALAGRKTNAYVVTELYHMSYEVDNLHDFYMLYYAMTDLRDGAEQYYWPNATRENLHDIITTQFKQWQYKHCGISPSPGETPEEVPAKASDDNHATVQMPRRSLLQRLWAFIKA